MQRLLQTERDVILALCYMLPALLLALIPYAVHTADTLHHMHDTPPQPLHLYLRLLPLLRCRHCRGLTRRELLLSWGLLRRIHPGRYPPSSQPAPTTSVRYTSTPSSASAVSYARSALRGGGGLRASSSPCAHTASAATCLQVLEAQTQTQTQIHTERESWREKELES